MPTRTHVRVPPSHRIIIETTSSTSVLSTPAQKSSPNAWFSGPLSSNCPVPFPETGHEHPCSMSCNRQLGTLKLAITDPSYYSLASFRRCWLVSNRFTARIATEASDRHPSCNPLNPPGRGMHTRSNPTGISSYAARNDSRNHRFSRFRTTALPHFRLTDRPIRVKGNPFGIA